MSEKTAKTQIKTTGINTHKIERTKIRWMLVFYDTFLYNLCWLIVSLFQNWAKRFTTPSSLFFYMVAGYVFFFGFRFIFKCYKQILRYGSVSAFARELVAIILGTGLLLIFGTVCGSVFEMARIPFIMLISFSALYSAGSIAIKIFYSYLYTFALKGSKASKFVKRTLELFTLVDFDSKFPGATLHFALESDQTQAPINEIQNIVDQFAIRGTVKKITQINKGYINRTYKVETVSDKGHIHKYTLQRINTNVFKDVDALMSNFKLTTEHMRGKFILPGHRKKGSVQTLRPTKDGCSYLKADSGCWRMLTYFDNVYSLDIPDSP